MSSADILRAARARIADPKNWTQGEMARDGSGKACPARSPNAVCWCAMGAVKVSGADFYSEAADLLWQVSHDLFGRGVPYVNDDPDEDLGHSAVLKIYDRAIELAESK